uniref:OmpA family protein n=1 Tax=Candidatus Kentrum sp. FW TaxID=2126338 RepID=A0A450TCZ0_9GAMM|nr:MAG: OmpA family protein [Candidatus Kentron sp. FW]
MNYSGKPGIAMAKRRLLLIGAGGCFVLGMAVSVSHGVWFTHVISSSERIMLCPESSPSVSVVSCPPTETEALHPVEISPDIRGGETETFIATGGDNSVSHLPQPLPAAPFHGEEPNTVDTVPYISGVGKTKIREGSGRESNPIPFRSVVSRILLNESIITFRWGKHTLGPEASRDLEAVVQTLLQYPESTVEVAAHTDRTGPHDYNEQLSRYRAHAVTSFLMGKGIAEIRIWWKGYGPSQPEISDNTPAARAKNRRAEVRVWGYST